jgi:hypothetical protein
METGTPLDRHNLYQRSFTLETYSHVLPGMGDTAPGAMDEALG